jgi:hypothetical protein
MMSGGYLPDKTATINHLVFKYSSQWGNHVLMFFEGRIHLAPPIQSESPLASDKGLTYWEIHNEKEMGIYLPIYPTLRIQNLNVIRAF